MQFFRSITVAILLLINFSISMESVADDNIPEPLLQWQSWVKADMSELDCPNINHTPYAKPENHICIWGSELMLDFSERSGMFYQRWQVFNEKSWIELPGGESFWPVNVMVNNRPIAVVNHQGKPQLLLEQGDHQIRGQFLWSQLPTHFDIPANTALFELKVNGDINRNVRVENGEIWLGVEQESLIEANKINLEVVRKLRDGPFLELTTRLDLQVSGQAREENLGQVLPEGFSVSNISSPIPAFLNNQGQLQIKALPGDWQIEIRALAKPEMTKLARPENKKPWPTQEVWVYEAAESLRMSKITGPSPIDTSQAYLPYQWKMLPGYLMEPEQALEIKVSHRGVPAQIRNELTLRRKLWLNFDGQEFTFADHLTGKMIKDWRLSMPEPYQLESAQDEDGNLLVSRVGELRGVENRYPQVDVKAQGQITSTSTFQIGGWQQPFDRIDYQIQLPPAYRLVAIFGADNTSNTWLDNWNLWNSFVVLFITGLIASLFNKPLAALSLLTLILIYHEPGAPIVLITVALLFVALSRQLLAGKLATISAWLAKSAVLVALISCAYFSATQLRLIVYPQLEHRHVNERYQGSPDLFDGIVVSHSDIDQAEAQPVKRKSEPVTDSIHDDVEVIEVTGARMKSVDLLSRYQANAPLQAGSGRPDWYWNYYHAQWSSPVSEQQQLSLWVLSPMSYNLIRIVGLVLLALMIWILITNTLKASGGLKSWLQNRPKAAANSKASLAVLFAIASGTFLTPSHPVNAQGFPDQSMLTELQQRLMAPPKCHPSCATIQSLSVEGEREQLVLNMAIHALEPVAVALPQSQQWRPQSVLVNNKNAEAILSYRHRDYLLVQPGITRITMSGQIYRQDTIAIRFHEKPEVIDSKIQSWEVTGVHKNRLQNNSLELVPQTSSEQKQSGTFKQGVKPFVRVERQLTFDESWNLITWVKRIAPVKGAINLEIDLLPGEKVFSSDTVVSGQKVKASMSADEESIYWHSNIPRLNQFSWQATDSERYIEQWRIVASPSWNLSLDGVPLVISEPDEDDYFRHNFYPQTGETLNFEINRPPAVAGKYLAIDNALLKWSPGKRISNLELSFNYRSTKASQHNISLPDGYQLAEVFNDGKRLQLQSEQGQLMLPISPGKHFYQLTFTSDQGIQSSTDFPVINLNVPVSNIKNQLAIGGERWLLFTSGPSVGPAIVYWGELIIFILAALLLAKLNFSPLSLWQWLLLGLGISTNNWSVFIMVVLTFATIHVYQRPANDNNWRAYNLGKLAITLLAIATLLGLVAIIPYALLSSPDMGITGNQSNNYHLNWFTDRSSGLTPDIWVLSLPTLVYKGVMLLWVMWLSFTFIGWVKWVWKRLREDGFLMAKPVIVKPKADNLEQQKADS